MSNFITNTIDMEDNEFRQKIEGMLLEQKRKKKESNREYAARTCQVASPYEPYAPTPPPKTGNEIKIETLTKENQKLREDYAGLVKKANTLVGAYRELKTENETLKTENETLKKKKAKRDSVIEVFNGVGKSGRNIYQKFIDWLKT